MSKRLLVFAFGLVLPLTARAAPTVTSVSSSGEASEGAAAWFSVAYGWNDCHTPPTFSWEVNGVPLVNGGGVSGVSSQILNIASAMRTMAGSIRVVLRCDTGATPSDPISFVVNQSHRTSIDPPIISTLYATAPSGGSSTISWTGVNGAIPATQMTLTSPLGFRATVTGRTSYPVPATQPTVYTLTAYNDAGILSRSIAVIPSGWTTLSACPSAPLTTGRYWIPADLPAPKGRSCLNVANTHDVYIACASPTVTINGSASYPAATFSNTETFSLSNCTLASPGYGNVVASFDHANRGVITSNTFGATSQRVSLSHSNYLNFISNTIHDNLYGSSSSGNTLVGNTITSAGYQTDYIVIFGSSGNNVLYSNTIDGGAAPYDPRTGVPCLSVDDGVMLASEANDVVANNVIENTCDAGIEMTGTAINHYVSANLILDASYGVMFAYSGKMTGTTVALNYVGGMSRPGSNGLNILAGGQFLHNSFYYNTVANAAGAVASLFAVPAGYSVSDVLITGNDFGTGVPWPTFSGGALSVTDGGMNYCTHGASQPYPILCN